MESNIADLKLQDQLDRQNKLVWRNLVKVSPFEQFPAAFNIKEKEAKCLFSKEDILKYRRQWNRIQPSDIAVQTDEQEQLMRHKASHLIRYGLGDVFCTDHKIINSAIMLMHRFYVFHPIRMFPYAEVAAASFVLGVKFNNGSIRLDDLTKKVFEYLDENYDIHYPERNSIVFRHHLEQAESFMLLTLANCTEIENNLKIDSSFFEFLNIPSDVIKTTYYIHSNLFLITTFCLKYPMILQNAFSLYRACKDHKFQIADPKWYKGVDNNISIGMLEKMSEEYEYMLQKSSALYINLNRMVKKKTQTSLARESKTKIQEENNNDWNFKASLPKPKNDQMLEASKTTFTSSKTKILKPFKIDSRHDPLGLFSNKDEEENSKIVKFDQPKLHESSTKMDVEVVRELINNHNEMFSNLINDKSKSQSIDSHSESDSNSSENFSYSLSESEEISSQQISKKDICNLLPFPQNHQNLRQSPSIHEKFEENFSALCKIPRLEQSKIHQNRTNKDIEEIREVMKINNELFAKYPQDKLFASTVLSKSKNRSKSQSESDSCSSTNNSNLSSSSCDPTQRTTQKVNYSLLPRPKRQPSFDENPPKKLKIDDVEVHDGNSKKEHAPCMIPRLEQPKTQNDIHEIREMMKFHNKMFATYPQDKLLSSTPTILTKSRNNSECQSDSSTSSNYPCSSSENGENYTSARGPKRRIAHKGNQSLLPRPQNPQKVQHHEQVHQMHVNPPKKLKIDEITNDNALVRNEDFVLCGVVRNTEKINEKTIKEQLNNAQTQPPQLPPINREELAKYWSGMLVKKNQKIPILIDVEKKNKKKKKKEKQIKEQDENYLEKRPRIIMKFTRIKGTSNWIVS